MTLYTQRTVDSYSDLGFKCTADPPTYFTEVHTTK